MEKYTGHGTCRALSETDRVAILTGMDERIRRIRTALTGDLPGASAWQTMLPPYRSRAETIPHPDTKPLRAAAVLILLHDRDGSLTFPILERSADLRHHAGQPGLPGGALEPGETAIGCALRETAEEIGVAVQPSSILGTLSDIVATPSGYLVRPFVAWSPALPAYTLNRGEIDDVFEVRLEDLFDPGRIHYFERTWEDRLWRVPCFAFAGHHVWGLTAMILAELRTVLMD